MAGKEGVGQRADGALIYFEYSRKPFGSFAERTAIDARQRLPLPDGLDPALAVCLGVSGLAALGCAEWRARLAPGETVLVLGASGVVGQIAVQAAKLLGAGRVVAAARDAAMLEHAGELGADALVRLGGDDDLAGELKSASGGEGFDVVLDPLWGEPAVAAIAAAIARSARVVNLGQSAGAEATLASVAVRSRPIDLLGYTNYTAGEDVKATAYARMAGHAARGEIRVAIERLGLDDVPAAWERQASSPHAKLSSSPRRSPWEAPRVRVVANARSLDAAAAGAIAPAERAPHVHAPDPPMHPLTARAVHERPRSLTAAPRCRCSRGAAARRGRQPIGGPDPFSASSRPSSGGYDESSISTLPAKRVGVRSGADLIGRVERARPAPSPRSCPASRGSRARKLEIAGTGRAQ